jgi:hypothetical protein
MPYLTVHLSTSIRAEKLVKVFQRNLAVLVDIKNLKGNFDVVLVSYCFSAYTSAQEFLEVNHTISIVVNLVDDVAPVDIMHFVERTMRHFLKFVLVNSSILIFVKPYEFLLQFLKLILGHRQA